MNSTEIVEVYSAADPLEAQVVADALEQAGIAVQVVGESLQAALPLGQRTAPRIWVHRDDEARARDLIAQLQAATAAGEEALLEEAEENGLGPPQPASEAEGDAAAPAEEARSLFSLSLPVALLGLLCLVAAAYYALANYRLREKYSGTAEAVLVDARQYSKFWYSDRQPGPFGYDVGHTLWYLYTVDDTDHVVLVQDRPAERVLRVWYDPEDPADCLFRKPAHPAWFVIFGGALGGLLLFLAYQFR